MATPFHLALPCLSISKTRAFYHDLLGAQIGRSSVKWIDVNFYKDICLTSSTIYIILSRTTEMSINGIHNAPNTIINFKTL